MQLFYRTYYIFIFMMLFITLSAQKYSRIRIDLQEFSIEDLSLLGFATDHGSFQEGNSYINVFSEDELSLLKEVGIPFEMLVEDATKHFLEQNKNPPDLVTFRTNPVCSQPVTLIPTPENYSLGSMGGYFTYEELLENLDRMVEKYPHLITAKTPISSTTTEEGRFVYTVKISDNPNKEESEPELLYTALHHAREPGSLTQMIFFMWYLLENYEQNEEVKYLVDQTAFHFIPCLNPDGYVFNQNTAPDGGGFWRKNRWKENGKTYGVDLNRNYGDHWGDSDIGSSPDKESNTFRGTHPFSEPEISGIRDFALAHQFKLVLNYHAYGNLLIYPWGFGAHPTPHQDIYEQIAGALVQENGYNPGSAIETVRYLVNGSSDDWFYGEQDLKPLTFAFTPEIGTDRRGFWPPRWLIDYNNKSALEMNLRAAHVLHNYVLVEEQSTALLPSKNGNLQLQVKQVGLSPGDIRIQIQTPGREANIQQAERVLNLKLLEQTNPGIRTFRLEPGVVASEIPFVIEVDNGIFVSRDTDY